jgi:hypothetical protein
LLINFVALKERFDPFVSYINRSVFKYTFRYCSIVWGIQSSKMKYLPLVKKKINKRLSLGNDDAFYVLDVEDVRMKDILD